MSYRHFPFDLEILDAMTAYNAQDSVTDKFTLVDAMIMSLIHSYNYSNKPFFASNDYLARICFSTPATIQKSINRLCTHGLIDKQVNCANKRKQRFLTYNEAAVEAFKQGVP